MPEHPLPSAIKRPPPRACNGHLVPMPQPPTSKMSSSTILLGKRPSSESHLITQQLVKPFGTFLLLHLVCPLLWHHLLPSAPFISIIRPPWSSSQLSMPPNLLYVRVLGHFSQEYPPLLFQILKYHYSPETFCAYSMYSSILASLTPSNSQSLHLLGVFLELRKMYPLAVFLFAICVPH